MLFRNEKKDEREPSSGPVRVPLLPLRDIIVFPHMVVPLFVGRQRSIKALEEATQKQSLIFLSSQKDAKTNDPTEDDIYKIGTLGSVVQMLKLPDGTVKVLIEGKRRARVARFVANPIFSWWMSKKPRRSSNATRKLRRSFAKSTRLSKIT